jgi:hypothetical protein
MNAPETEPQEDENEIESPGDDIFKHTFVDVTDHKKQTVIEETEISINSR